MDSRHKEQGWICVKTKFVVIFGHKSNGKPIDCRLVYPTTMKLAPNVCWFILWVCIWWKSWEKTLVMDTVTLKRKFGFALLCVVAEGTGRRCSESQRVEIWNLLIYFWRVKKFVFFEYNSETNIKADDQKLCFWS